MNLFKKSGSWFGVKGILNNIIAQDLVMIPKVTLEGPKLRKLPDRACLPFRGSMDSRSLASTSTWER